MDAEDEIEGGRTPVRSEGVEKLAESAEGEPAVSGETAVRTMTVVRERAEAETVRMAVPEIEQTGHVDVDAALDRLRELGERPTGAHPDLYDGVHQRLQEVLAHIDHQDAGR